MRSYNAELSPAWAKASSWRRLLTDRDEEPHLAELIARHGPIVLGICRRWLDDPHDVEDAFQATFLILAAARELGWPIGTVKSRLASGRTPLTHRLTRRGVAPSVVLGAGHAADRFSAIVLSEDIAKTTIEAALRAGSGTGVKGAADSASVQALFQGVLMSHAPLKNQDGCRVVDRARCPDLYSTGVPCSPPPPAPPVMPASATLPAATPSTLKIPRLDLFGDPLPTGAAGRLGTVRHRQGSPIFKIAYSPDGKYVVTDGDDEKLRVWDANDGRLIREIESGKGWLRDFAISRDNKLLAAGSLRTPGANPDTLNIAVNDLATGRRDSQISRNREGNGILFQFSPDGRWLVHSSG